MSALDRRLWRNILDSKLQFVAIVVVIAMGLISFVVLNNTYQSLEDSLSKYYERQVFSDVFAEFTSQPASYIENLESLPQVQRAEGRIVSDIRGDVGREVYPELQLISVSDDPKINIPLVEEGRLPAGDARDEVAVISGFANANDISVGDEIDLIVRGEPVTVTVSGIVDSPEFIYVIKSMQNFLPDEENFGVVFVGFEFAQDLIGMPGQVNDAVFVASEGTTREDAKEAIEEEMEGRGLHQIITRDDQLSHFIVDIELEQLEQMSMMVPVVFLTIAATIIYMLLMRLVQADRTVIGVLKAVGYSNRQVLMHYLKYALFLGMLGAATGMILGHLFVEPVAGVYMQFFDIPLWEMQIDWTFIFLGIFLTLVFCGGTGIWATRGVLKIVPADAMRPAAPPPGKKNLMEMFLPRLWERLSFSYKLVLRQVLRNKKRFLLSVLGVAFAFTIVFMPFYMLSVVDSMFFDQFERFEVYDYSVSFEDPISDHGISQMKDIVDVNQLEPFVEHPFDLESGWRDETLVVRALPADADLQRFEDSKGNRISVPASGILISEYVAETLGVSAGDEVVLSSHITPHDHRLKVRAVITQYLGSGAYISLDQMSKISEESRSYTGALVTSDDDIIKELQTAGNVTTIYSTGEMIEGFNEFIGLMIAAYTMLIAVGGVLAFAILFNTTSVGISERTREFASMRVLGYRTKTIYNLLLHENILATIFGIILGIPTARAVTVALAEFVRSDLFYLPTLIQPTSYLIAAALVCGFVALVMWAIWGRVKNLNLLQALSSRMT